jgi:hypothetical protein
MKLREWAEKQGISYRTALRWFHGGTLPVEAEQMATGTIIVKLETIFGGHKAALYARVSSLGLARRSGPFRNLHLAPPSNLNKQQNRICGSGYRAFFLLAIVRLNR